MSPIEDDLRKAFRQLESLTPDTASLRSKITLAYVRAKRRRRIRRSVTAVAVALAAAALPLGIDRIAAGPPHAVVPADGGVTAPAEEPDPPAIPIDILLIGDDATGAPESVTLVHIPAGRDATYLISFPVDAKITQPGYQDMSFGSALRHGGTALTRSLVTSLTSVRPTLTVTYSHGALRSAARRAGVSTADLTNGYDLRLLEDAALRGRPAGGDKLEAIFRSVSGHVSVEQTDYSYGMEIVVAVDPSTLFDAAAEIPAAQVVALRDPAGRVYPGIAPTLFGAIGHDGIAAWVTRHPDYVLPD